MNSECSHIDPVPSADSVPDHAAEVPAGDVLSLPNLSGYMITLADDYSKVLFATAGLDGEVEYRRTQDAVSILFAGICQPLAIHHITAQTAIKPADFLIGEGAFG
jgi:hypothetical protein